MPPTEVCERARRIRDARFDGLFFTAVRTTRIYCRSICPAPCAKSENVTFYPTAAAASAAGYRPCMRCRPELAPVCQAGDNPALRQALRWIVDGWLEGRSVAALAAEVGVSDRQLRRLFVEGLGATPLQIHTTRRLLLARQLLAETSLPMAGVALAAGFNSVRRFNATFRQRCGAAPSSMRRHAGLVGDEGIRLRLAYRPPFNFRHTLAALRRSAVPGVECVDADTYRRVIGSSMRPGWVRVAAHDDKPELSLQAVGVPAEQIHALVVRVRRMFDLDADLMPANRLLARDPLLSESVATEPGMRIPGAWDGFECAVLLLLHRCAGEGGWRDLASALVDRHGTRIGRASDSHGHLFPSPACIAVARLEDQIGVPAGVASTIRRLSVAVRDGGVDFRAGQRLEPFVDSLVANAGLDVAAAHLVAMRVMSDPDAFPCDGDALHPWFGGPLTYHGTGFAVMSDAWRPWRAYALLRLGLRAAAPVASRAAAVRERVDFARPP